MAMKSVAPGGPGMPPRWTRGAKEAVGTAYASGSRVWYTVAAGILTEVFYPTVDTPQIRDLQLLVTDGSTFVHDERRHTRSTVTCVDEAALGFDIVNGSAEPAAEVVVPRRPDGVGVATPVGARRIRQAGSINQRRPGIRPVGASTRPIRRADTNRAGPAGSLE